MIIFLFFQSSVETRNELQRIKSINQNQIKIKSRILYLINRVKKFLLNRFLNYSFVLSPISNRVQLKAQQIKCVFCIHHLQSKKAFLRVPL